MLGWFKLASHVRSVFNLARRPFRLPQRLAFEAALTLFAVRVLLRVVSFERWQKRLMEQNGGGGPGEPKAEHASAPNRTGRCRDCLGGRSRQSTDA
ncbi:MAG: hypothetical protein QM784_02820 [Polyangiaceae bacterium]